MNWSSPVPTVQSLDDEWTEGGNEEQKRKERGSEIDQEMEHAMVRLLILALQNSGYCRVVRKDVE